MSRPQSAKTNIIRKIALLVVALLGSAIILHVALPWYDMFAVFGSIFQLVDRYPTLAIVPIAIVFVMLAMATVDDWIRGV